MIELILARKKPEELKEMQDLFIKAAEKFYVLPIDDHLTILFPTRPHQLSRQFPTFFAFHS
jgi:hypothetical protein